MEVEIATTAPVAHVPLTVSWDPALLELEKVVWGDFLGSGKNAVFVSDSTTPGELAVEADRVAGASGVAGHGALARIHFRALSVGIAAVAVGVQRVQDAERYELAAVASPPSEVEIRDGEDSGATLQPVIETLGEPADEPDGGS